MRRDLHNDCKWTNAEPPVAAVTDNTPYVSSILDTAEFFANEFLGLLGAIADADVSFTVLVEHGDQANLSDAAAVPDSQLLGTEAGAAFLFSDDNKAFKIGYRGSKRYIRVTITPANNSGNLFLAAGWLQAFPRVGAQTTQVV